MNEEIFNNINKGTEITMYFYNGEIYGGKFKFLDGDDVVVVAPSGNCMGFPISKISKLEVDGEWF